MHLLELLNLPIDAPVAHLKLSSGATGEHRSTATASTAFAFMAQCYLYEHPSPRVATSEGGFHARLAVGCYLRCLVRAVAEQFDVALQSIYGTSYVFPVDLIMVGTTRAVELLCRLSLLERKLTTLATRRPEPFESRTRRWRRWTTLYCSVPVRLAKLPRLRGSQTCRATPHRQAEYPCRVQYVWDLDSELAGKIGNGHMFSHHAIIPLSRATLPERLAGTIPRTGERTPGSP